MFSTIIAILLAGCQTKDSSSQIKLPPPAEIEVNKSLLTSSIEYKTTDGLFEISGTTDKLDSFIVKEPNSDVRDLSSFAGYAGDGDLKSVKYFVENHYDKIGDRQWKEAIDFAVNGRHIDVAEYLNEKMDFAYQKEDSGRISDLFQFFK